MRILDKYAVVRWEETDDGQRGCPEINRADLRDLFASSEVTAGQSLR
jgi:hypothetical protein